jgi:methionyl-tRNA formyltransferase
MSLRVVFMGTPAFAVPSLDALLDSSHCVLGVVTQPDRPVGRGRRPQASPVKMRAQEAGIAVWEPVSVREASFPELLRGASPEVIVVVAYGQILPRAILDLPPLGCVNVHASLLPRYRGAAPIQWAILNGEQATGVTVIRMVERMDAGDILMARSVEIGGDEDALQLGQRLSRVGSELLKEVLGRLGSGQIRPGPQREEETSYAPRLRTEDGEIRWEMGAQEIARRVRGLLPWPVAHSRWRGRLLKVYRARPLPGGLPGRPGEVVRADHGALWVRTGTGCLELLEVQLENRPRMPAADFVRGHGQIMGETLECKNQMKAH